MEGGRIRTDPKSRDTLILTAQDVASLLPMQLCVSAVERAFHQLGNGEAEPPASLGLHARNGGFHVKSAILDLGRRYYVVKTNGNFPANRSSNGLPTIQGVVVLCDADNGRVLAILDSIEITARRTAAATAVAARHMAHEGASVAAICGCGYQAASQLEALATVVRLNHVVAYDRESARAEQFSAAMSARFEFDVVAADLNDAAAREPDIWITCTTSQEFFLSPDHVKPGAFIAGVGVDSENKKELAPELLRDAHVVTDQTAQCERIGDLHHALAAGYTPRSICELGEVVAGRRAGRHGTDEIRVFDSTGIAAQDVAAAAVVFEQAVLRDDGSVMAVDFTAVK